VDDDEIEISTDNDAIHIEENLRPVTINIWRQGNAWNRSRLARNVPTS